LTSWSPSAPFDPPGGTSTPAPSSRASSSDCSWIDIIALNARDSLRTSSRVLPFTAADIIEAEDWLIEQPCPPMRTSRTTSPSRSRYTTISSPHSGLNPSTRVLGGTGSSPRFRGFR
jgi:hypothetical protein